ncbi:protein SEEDLING PLASTID DEVELOPMENT 1 [Tripterygium wilfordii]|uniref:protein SEEDLING PLASTID DEVELOPMENT 1 n=1 Tax=Tripterygium wilfordii TaxID=458696 RepID=UPI0018F83FEF|nr:protein SEEDLING PLASTID DEVELOPMENT 1 [Tripterygium wilfordii]
MLCYSLPRNSLPSLPTKHLTHRPPLCTKSRLRTTLHFSPNPYIFTRKLCRFQGFISCFYSSSLTSVVSVAEDDFDVELGRLLALLPEEMRRKCSDHEELENLIEVVMDLGRKPLARFPSGDFVLSDCPITVQDLEHATSQVGDFAVDNRAGISRTLHRISAIRNRKGSIIGLTCRVGRAISGSANLLRDLVEDGASLLLIGPPGVGKTTIIREIARMLANDYEKRVMIVDTSNEIGGDGDIPHAGIGNARRMQVPNSDMQHKVLIEAVENHMPQVIVIDEIGTKLEAMAASTIAQRGIQLVATAHGVTIENLVMNPSLEMLVGGVQSVTLGDEEANRRRVQKTVLERKGPSTFSCGVEIISQTELRIHCSLEATVDNILSGRIPKFEVRKTNSHGSVEMMQPEPLDYTSTDGKEEIINGDAFEMTDAISGRSEITYEISSCMGDEAVENETRLRMYAYGIVEASVIQGIKKLKLDDAIQLTDNISEADALLALQSRLKKNPRIQSVARSRDVPIYVVKTSSLLQITKAIRAFMTDHADGLMEVGSEDYLKSSEKTDAIEETRIAIVQVVIPKGEPANLLPRPSHIMSLQIDLIQKYQLKFEMVGMEPGTHIRILPFQTMVDDDGDDEADDGLDDYLRASGDTNESLGDTNGSLGNTNGSLDSVDRLPLLPE